MRWLPCLSLLSAAAGTPAVGFRKTYTANATRLRAHLLSGYDPKVAPESTRVGNYSAAGADVSMQIRFFKVESVKASDGNMRLKVWLRMSWTDERLAWDPTVSAKC